MNRYSYLISSNEPFHDISADHAIEMLRKSGLDEDESLVIAGKVAWNVAGFTSGIGYSPLFIVELLLAVFTHDLKSKYVALTEEHLLIAAHTMRRGMREVVVIPHDGVLRIDVCLRKSGFWTLKSKDGYSHLHIHLKDGTVLRFPTSNHDFAIELLSLDLPTVSIEESDVLR